MKKLFLYPTSRQFPFDEACEKIVRALHARAWKVPDFEVTFYDYGSGEQWMRCVRTIESTRHDVRLYFSRIQRLLVPDGRYNDIAAASDLRIPGQLLSVHEDESGPRLYRYIGDDWEADRARFTHAALFDDVSKLTLVYKGDRRWRDVRPTHLASLDGGPHLETAEVMAAFRAYLEGLLAVIEATPAVNDPPDPCPEDPPIPYPADLGPLYTYAERGDLHRMREKREDLRPSDRYAIGVNYRLVPMGPSDGLPLPEIARDGFIWCRTSPTLLSKEHYTSFAEHLVRVTPRDARGIYVADNAIYENLRKSGSEALLAQGRACFTGAEVSSFQRARGRSIVPLLEYKGDYADPIYLINRELGLDEVQAVGELEA